MFIISDILWLWCLSGLREFKKELGRMEVDWPNHVREVIKAKIKKEKLRLACALMDESRRRTRSVKFNSVKVIRETRETR